MIGCILLRRKFLNLKRLPLIILIICVALLLIFRFNFQLPHTSNRISPYPSQKCTPVHFAVVLPEPNYVRKLFVMLKSLLSIYRFDSVLKFHILTRHNHVFYQTSVMLETWQISNFEYSVYNKSSNLVESLANVERIILLDADVLFDPETAITKIWWLDGFQQLVGSDRSLGLVAEGETVDMFFADINAFGVINFQSLVDMASSKNLTISTVTTMWSYSVQEIDSRQWPLFYNWRRHHADANAQISRLKTIESNGYYLRLSKHSCSNVKVPVKPGLNNYKDCEELNQNYQLVRRELLFYYPEHNFQGSSNAKPDGKVGLATHLDFPRLSQLELICRSWMSKHAGPISVALYIYDQELVQFEQALASAQCIGGGKVHFHVVFKQGSLYPINYLRNVAMKHSSSEYLLHLDVDFVPSLKLAEINIKSLMGGEEKIAVVIPAFEISGLIDSSTFSFAQLSGKELLELWNKGSVQPFHIWRFFEGHGPTNYSRWRTEVSKIADGFEAADSYDIRYQKNYEPYVILRNPGKTGPQFDERFSGYGYNKVSFMRLLQTLGYGFRVSTKAFVVHVSHFASFDLLDFRRDAERQRCVTGLLIQYTHELNQLKKAKTTLSSNSEFIE